jgi:hypothetical protein
MIAQKVKEIESKLVRECPGDGKIKPEKVIEEIDKLSTKILKIIQHKPSEAPLTTIAKCYVSGSWIGCGGVDSVTVHKNQPCPCERNHKGQQGPKQKKENINFNLVGNYTLQAGK